MEADGSLMCGYHGWRWNGDGKAICIPQACLQQLQCLVEKAFGVLLINQTDMLILALCKILGCNSGGSVLF